jgi:hypothetical protein
VVQGGQQQHSIEVGRTLQIWVSRLVVLVLGLFVLGMWAMLIGSLFAAFVGPSGAPAVSGGTIASALVGGGFVLTFTAIYCWNVYQSGFRIAHWLVLRADGALHFRSAFRSGTVSVRDIVAIEDVGTMTLHLLRIRHRQGSFIFSGMPDAALQMVRWIHAMNPSIEIGQRARARLHTAGQLGRLAPFS